MKYQHNFSCENNSRYSKSKIHKDLELYSLAYLCSSWLIAHKEKMQKIKISAKYIYFGRFSKLKLCFLRKDPTSIRRHCRWKLSACCINNNRCFILFCDSTQTRNSFLVLLPITYSLITYRL